MQRQGFTNLVRALRREENNGATNNVLSGQVSFDVTNGMFLTS